MKKKEVICQQQTYSNRMAKESSLNRKSTVKEGTLEHQKNMVSKNIGKYNRFPFSS